MSAPLRADGLRCSLGRRTVLTDVSLTAEPGETIGVVGPNGSGKSTLLRALAGILRPAGGEVLVDGVRLDRLTARQRAQRVALVPQEEDLPADFLVGEFVALGTTPYRAPWSGGGDAERAAVAAALRSVDLAGFEDRPVDRLSGGERRRVLLARGFAQRTPLLLLDEPTNHLDVHHRLQLLRLVRGSGRTCVLSLHDLSLAAATCDRILVLHGGTAGPATAPDEALTPEVVRAVFGVEATPVTHPRTGKPHLLIGDIEDDSCDDASRR
ncbi:ABC transporter ATP-binding protein [Saccharopolyspora gloriosae]|uniref:Iron complex transport system ATP-binding protein n=1 Tax=Saccharopolyspora gloriosae TaxID=455344 RepID=A0A840NIT4_9PSEU|nr:iron complex transport system ATP-binding protein [Saccharopolyspora gloriosae]